MSSNNESRSRQSVGYRKLTSTWSVSRNVRVRCEHAPGHCVPRVFLRRLIDRLDGGRVGLCQCESGSVASLDACDRNQSVWIGRDPVVRSIVLTGLVACESGAPWVGSASGQRRVNDCVGPGGWLIVRTIDSGTVRRDRVVCGNTIFPGLSLYPEDGFCAW